MSKNKFDEFLSYRNLKKNNASVKIIIYKTIIIK